MSQSIVGAELPLGKLVFLAWITAALLKLFGRSIVFDFDSEPNSFLYQAALLFGYYLSFVLGLRLILIILRIFASRMRDWLVSENTSRLANVLAIFLAYLLYPTSILNVLGGIGLCYALYLYLAGIFESDKKAIDADCPTSTAHLTKPESH